MAAFNLVDEIKNGVADNQIVLDLITSKNPDYQANPLTTSNVELVELIDISNEVVNPGDPDTKIVIDAIDFGGYRGRTSFKYKRADLQDFFNTILGDGAAVASYPDEKIKDIFDIIKNTFNLRIDQSVFKNLTDTVDWENRSATLSIKDDSLIFTGSASLYLYRKLGEYPFRGIIEPGLGGDISVDLAGSLTRAIIDWGDGVIETVESAGRYNHTPRTSLTTEISVYGIESETNDIDLRVFGDPLVEVISFCSSPSVFSTAMAIANSTWSENLVKAPSYLPPNITNTRRMFCRCSKFNDPVINNWDTSNVTYMYAMFYVADAFNQPLNNWNVSNVTNMEWMFSNCNSFNQDISMWDVSSVTAYGNFNSIGGIIDPAFMPNFQ